jgi:integrase
MNYSPRRDIPDFARQLKTLSASAICRMILNRRNVKRSPESVTMWFKDHAEVKAELDKEILEGLPTKKEAVDRSIYDNGNFRELPSVQNWIKELTNRNAKEDTIKNWVSALKSVCIGELRAKKKNREKISIVDWALKHPDRLSPQDAKDFIFEMKKRGLKSRRTRLALRNFLTSKEIVVKNSDISGDLEDDAGQYADLFVSKEKCHELLGWLKIKNYEAYLASHFAYKTAARLTATLEADSQYINEAEKTITVFEKSIKGKSKKRVRKLIPFDLWEELKGRKGKLFNIDAVTLNSVLREAYELIIPEIAHRIKMPFHFWRHMFAQHMLRASNWNYGLVASLGNWDMKTLRTYYGMPPEEMIREFGFQTLPQI